jgi:hypothetical protein
MRVISPCFTSQQHLLLLTVAKRLPSPTDAELAAIARTLQARPEAVLSWFAQYRRVTAEALQAQLDQAQEQMTYCSIRKDSIEAQLKRLKRDDMVPNHMAMQGNSECLADAPPQRELVDQHGGRPLYLPNQYRWGGMSSPKASDPAPDDHLPQDDANYCDYQLDRLISEGDVLEQLCDGIQPAQPEGSNEKESNCPWEVYYGVQMPDLAELEAINNDILNLAASPAPPAATSNTVTTRTTSTTVATRKTRSKPTKPYKKKAIPARPNMPKRPILPIPIHLYTALIQAIKRNNACAVLACPFATTQSSGTFPPDLCAPLLEFVAQHQDVIVNDGPDGCLVEWANLKGMLPLIYDDVLQNIDVYEAGKGGRHFRAAVDRLWFFYNVPNSVMYMKVDYYLTPQ